MSMCVSCVDQQKDQSQDNVSTAITLSGNGTVYSRDSSGRDLDSTSQTNEISEPPFVMSESFSQEDIAENNYKLEELKSIRANFKRINSISDWTDEKKSVSKNWHNTYYYLENNLEKIISKKMTDSSLQINEYYFMNGPSMVIEKYAEYFQEDEDGSSTKTVDRSSYIETKSYFKDNKVIHQISNQDCGSPFSETYLQEEYKRILKDYNTLLTTIE